MRIFMRGDIWSVDLGNPVGSEQGGVRPCLIIQNDMGNEYSPTVIVLPITSKRKNYSVSHVEIDLGGTKSYILCEQIRVVDKTRCKRQMIKIDNATMSEVESKVRVQLGL